MATQEGSPEAGTCEFCGNRKKKLVTIDSGQRICEACRRLLHPRKFTRAAVATRVAKRNAGELQYLLRDAWLQLVGTKPAATGISAEQISAEAISFAKAEPIIARRLVKLQAERSGEGDRIFRMLYAENGNAPPVDPKTGEKLQFWDFSPPVPENEDTALIFALVRRLSRPETPT